MSGLGKQGDNSARKLGIYRSRELSRELLLEAVFPRRRRYSESIKSCANSSNIHGSVLYAVPTHVRNMLRVKDTTRRSLHGEIENEVSDNMCEDRKETRKEKLMMS